MITEAIDFRYLLLENYKSLKIKEDELATILMIDHYIDMGNPFVTADLLALKMTLKTREIDQILANLLTKGYLEFVTKGKETVTSLEPLKTRLFKQFQISLTKEESRANNQKLEESLENIFGEYQKLLNRPLAPVEISTIHEWVNKGYSDDMIINALKEALSKGKKTIRSVDKILMSWSIRDDIEKEGVSAITEDWQKNIEETIRIAKTPWVNVDDDDTKK